MCDCGCGGSSSGCGGNCGGDCGQPTKIITVEKQGSSASTFYKGDDFTCAVDSSIDVSDGESLSSALNKILTKLCTLGNGGNYVFNTEDQLVITTANDGSIVKSTTGLGVIKRGEGLRMTIGGQFSSVTDAAGIVLNFNYIGIDAAAAEANSAIDSWTIPQSTAADRFKIEITLTLDSATDNFGYVYEVRTNDGLNESVISNYTSMPPLATYSNVGLELSATVNGTDQIIFHSVVFEHLR